MPDARAIREWIERGTTFLAGMYNYSGIQFVKPPRRAVVIGGGFIGLETAENLVHAGFEVTLVEMLDQVLAPLDREFARLVEEHVKRHGVQLALGDGVAGFTQLDGGALEVQTKSGKAYPADMVILALGVRPDTTLAKSAGLEIGERGGIRVDEHMRTSDPDIFAVGDAIEVKDFVTGQWSLVALAGPANRQGRIAADVIAGRDSRYRGTQGTSIIGLFGGAAAWTGVSEKTLKELGDDDYEKIYLFPNSHAGYYPGAKMLALKVIFRKSDGRVLGAQALGEDGPAVDKRISALAMAIQMGATIYDLEEAELCYAPQFGSAKDAVNFAGMVAAEFCAETCRSPTGTTPRVRSCSTCASRWSSSWRACRARSTSRWATARAARRAPPRPRDPDHLPLRAARLLRDAHPGAERVQGPHAFRRDAGASRPCGSRGIRRHSIREGRVGPRAGFRRPQRGAIGSQHDVHESNPESRRWFALAMVYLHRRGSRDRVRRAGDRAGASGSGRAAPPPAAKELDALVGRIALYPDDLVGIILPASTNPLQLVQADRFLDKRKADPKLPVDEKWDDAVKSLLNYPDVVKMMSGDLDWTSALGEAVVADQGDVIEAVQAFRRKAQAAGNLKSDDKQVVKVEKEIVYIEPADPQVIYVPQYNPATVVVYGPAPVCGHYPMPYRRTTTRIRPARRLPPASSGVRRSARPGAATTTAAAGTTNININRNTNINRGNVNRGGRRRPAAAPRGSRTSSPARSAAPSARRIVGARGRMRRAGGRRCEGRPAAGRGRGSGAQSRRGGAGPGWRGRRGRHGRLRLGAADPDGQFPRRLEPRFDGQCKSESIAFVVRRRRVALDVERRRCAGRRWWGRWCAWWRWRRARWRRPSLKAETLMRTFPSLESKALLMNITRFWSFLFQLALALMLAVPLAAATPPQDFATPEAAVDASWRRSKPTAKRRWSRSSAMRTRISHLLRSRGGERQPGEAPRGDATLRVLQRAEPGSPGAGDRRSGVADAIPIVRAGDRWRFATEEGAEEVVNRRVGGNERNAIYVLQRLPRRATRVCRARSRRRRRAAVRAEARQLAGQARRAVLAATQRRAKSRARSGR